MNEETDIALLERYLQNTLTAEEQTLVQNRLAEEAAFQKLHQDMLVLQEGIRQSTRAELKVLLNDFENQIPKSRSIYWKPWAVGIAASLLIMMAAYWLWPKPTTNEKLFAQYFEPYPNVIMPTVRGDLEPDTTLIAKGYRAYDQGQYAIAIKHFEQVSEKDEGVYLYLGNSYLATNNPDKAIVCFEKVLNDYDVFDEQAEWYLVLCYIKSGKLQLAKNLSDRISKTSGSYSHKASIISSNLNH